MIERSRTTAARITKGNRMSTTTQAATDSPSVDAACSIARGEMARWPAYRATDQIKVKRFDADKIFIGYNVDGGSPGWYWTANVIDDVFYLLSIFLPHAMRGKGLGNQLYEIITDIAHELGCREIRQTPSGTTTTGESRLRYLIRRDWWPDGGQEVMKKLSR